MKVCNFILFPFLFFYALPLQVLGMGSDWVKIESISDAVDPLVTDISNKLFMQLKKEKSNTIFLNVKACKPSLTNYANQRWCESFISRLQMNLIKRGILFLTETQTQEVRAKISKESLYQHGSMNVEADKAVALGKQASFDAFVTLEITGEWQKRISVAAQSLNIEKAAVTIMEVSDLKIKEKKYRRTHMLIGGPGLFATGLALHFLAYEMAKDPKYKADQHMKAYERADNPEDAIAERSQVEKYDREAAPWENLASLGALMAVAGGLYWYASYGHFQVDHYYRKENSSMAVSGKQTIRIQPAITRKQIGLKLSFDFN